MNSPLDQIPRLMALLAETGLGRLELSGPLGRVVLSRNETTPEGVATANGVTAPPVSPAFSSETIASPGIGTFRRAHPLHDEPLAEEGEHVAAGQVVALLQVGALLQPVRAPSDGVLSSVRPADGALIGFGDPLFDILPH